MTAVETAKNTLDAMLGHLGLPAEIEAKETEEGTCLQIFSADKDLIIGKDGDRLDDIQYLVNRILHQQNRDAPRVRVDCEHFRSMQEDDLHAEISELIELVKSQGKNYRVRPLNAYYRRLAYSTIAKDPSVEATSPPGGDRLKRITISPKSKA